MTERSDPRALAIAALRANPVVFLSEEQAQALRDPQHDLSFEDLGMDSMARMELSIWLELELGLEASESTIQEIGSVAGLASFIGERLGGR